jgi:hypothetical protein
MNNLQTLILSCEEATPLQFEPLFIEYKNALKKEIILENKSFEESLDLLIKYIDFIRNNNIHNEKVVKYLLLRWDSMEEEGDEDVEGVLGDLAATMLCVQKNLKYLIDVLKNSVNILSILDLHLRTRYGTGMVFSLVCERLLEAFHLSNLEDFQWDHLIDTADETLQGSLFNPHFISRESYSETQNNKDVKRYIENKRKTLLNEVKCKKPDYISIKTITDKDGNSTTESEELYKGISIVEDQNSEKLLLLMKDVIENNVIIKSKEDQETIEKLAQLSVSLKDNFIDENEEFPSERYYGVFNGIFEQDCCGKKGPCAMFYCMCREDTDYEDTSYGESINPFGWFNNICEECGIGIEKLRYALRFPVKDGGWTGCFCSFACMKKSNIRPIDKDDEFRIQEIKRCIEKIGVFDC